MGPQAVLGQAKRDHVPPRRLTRVDEPNDEPDWERNSTGRMVGGIVMTSIGGTVALVGVGYLMTAGICSGDDYRSEQAFPSTGATLTVGGTVLSLIGIPMIANGAKRVPRRNRYGAQLDVGPTSAVLKVSF